MKKNKKQLREILFALSTDEEKAEYLRNEKLDEVNHATKGIMEKMEDNSSNEAIIDALKDLSRQMSRIKMPDNSSVVEAINLMTERLAKENKPVDMSGFFKDFAVQIAETGASSKKTKELIQTLKWNSTMGIKNRDGTPISPNVSPFQISDYDNIVLENYNTFGIPGTVMYQLGTQIIKILTISCDNLGNIISVVSD